MGFCIFRIFIILTIIAAFAITSACTVNVPAFDPKAFSPPSGGSTKNTDGNRSDKESSATSSAGEESIAPADVFNSFFGVMAKQMEGVEPSRSKRGGVPAKVAQDSSMLSDVDREFPQSASMAGEYDIAVVIGNRDYRSAGVSRVDYADRDAASVRDLLVHSFGFNPRNVMLISDAGYTKFVEIFGPPGRPAVGKIFKMATASAGNATLFLYYSGHGAPSLETNEAFLVPVDAELSALDATGYPLKALYAAIDALPVRSATIILDACFSGSSDKGLLFQGISPAMVKVRDTHAVPRKAVLFSSGAVDQVSVWYPEKGHSLFTYYFLKGARGAADVNGDGSITVSEMKEYLGRAVPFEAQRLKGINQTPVVLGDGSTNLLMLKR